MNQEELDELAQVTANMKFGQGCANGFAKMLAVIGVAVALLVEVAIIALDWML